MRQGVELLLLFMACGVTLKLLRTAKYSNSCTVITFIVVENLIEIPLIRLNKIFILKIDH